MVGSRLKPSLIAANMVRPGAIPATVTDADRVPF